MKLYYGHRYTATIRLGLFEGWASNVTIADRLLSTGFGDVTVQGIGRTRQAFGTWKQPDADVDIPGQIDPATVKDIT